MKKLFFMMTMASCQFIQAQVNKQNVVEHFTNTSCSVCFNSNPKIQTALNGRINVLYISLHPSAPYTSDIFNQSNKTENDDRTKFYNVFGSTPKVMLNGTIVGDYNTFGTQLTGVDGIEKSNFDVKVMLAKNGSLDEATIVVKKVAADTTKFVSMWVGVLEDSVFQQTNNGEKIHFHVMRKALTPAIGASIQLPVNAGDSATWNYPLTGTILGVKTRLSVMAIIQQANKKVVNAGQSSNLKEAVVSAIDSYQERLNCSFENGCLQTPSSIKISQYKVLNALGVCCAEGYLEQQNRIDLNHLPSGIYRVILINHEKKYVHSIIKE